MESVESSRMRIEMTSLPKMFNFDTEEELEATTPGTTTKKPA